MPSTIKNIVDRFPFPSPLPIVGAPDYEKIAEVHLQLNSNATLVHSNLGNGALGLLKLTVLPDFYKTLSDTKFTPLMNTGPTPDITVRSTTAQIAALRYDHITAALIFDEYDRTEKALRQQLLLSIEKIFVRSLCHRYVS